MFPTIHGYEAFDLTTQGVGALTECLSCEVSEELNGAYTLELRFPLDGKFAEMLVPPNIIVASSNHLQPRQAFRINEVRKTFANSIVVYANHICYDLCGYPMKAPQNLNSLSDVINALNNASYSSGVAVYHHFEFDSNVYSSKPFTMEGAQTMRSWMGGQKGSILDTYGGEWEYDNFNCYLKSRRGEDTGFRISYGKNLAEYEKIRPNGLYSHVCAFWKKSDVLITGDLVPTGYGCPFRCAYYDASGDFDNTPTTADLNSAASANIASLNMNPQTITITPTQIGNKPIGLGDSVLICYEDVFETRVIKTVWDSLAERYKTLELGTKKTNIAETIKTLTTAPSGESGYVDPSADYVLEEGTSNGWFYRKWNGGKYECWTRDSSKKATITQSWGSFYYGSLSAWTYPITFVGDYPIVNITIQAANGGAWAVPNYSDYSFTSTGTIYLYRPSQITNMNLTVNIYAFGRWK